MINKIKKSKTKGELLKAHLLLHSGWNRINKGLRPNNLNKEKIVSLHAEVTDKLRELGYRMEVKTDLDKSSSKIEKTIVSSDVTELLKPGIKVLIPGRILPYPYGTKIWEGKKKAIVSNEHHKKYINRPVYLIEEDKALAIIEIKDPEEVKIEEFDELYEKHLVSDEERKFRWLGSDTLYCYEVEVISKFNPPKTIEKPIGPLEWMENVEFKPVKLSSRNGLGEKWISTAYRYILSQHEIDSWKKFSDYEKSKLIEADIKDFEKLYSRPENVDTNWLKKDSNEIKEFIYHNI